MEDHPSHIPKRRTLVKSRVGCVKTSTYDLPQGEHTYGYSAPSDPEGAGEIISNWVTANPSLHKEVERKLVYSNVLAIKHGAITATSMRKYAIEHPNIRLKESLHANSARVDSAHEGPFGIKTKFAEESMGNILQNKYGSYEDDIDYPTIAHIKKTGLMPKPKGTIASESVRMVRQKAEEEKEKKHFIMKKFQNIPGKLNIYHTSDMNSSMQSTTSN